LDLLNLGTEHRAGGHLRTEEVSGGVVFEAHTFFEKRTLGAFASTRATDHKDRLR
jgi:hypothetical protein